MHPLFHSSPFFLTRIHISHENGRHSYYSYVRENLRAAYDWVCNEITYRAGTADTTGGFTEALIQALAREALEKGNVFLHLDEIDEYSHMRDPEKKVAILERADRLMEKHFSDAERIVYFIDHGTSSITGEHLPISTPFRATYRTDIRRGELVSVGDLLPRLMSP